jgi:hypothetical protein
MISRVKILGHSYRVTMEPYLSQSGGNSGTCNNYENHINVASEISPSAQSESLFHEVIEAVVYRLDLGIPHRAIVALSEVLHQVIKDNPELVSIMTKEHI